MENFGRSSDDEPSPRRHTKIKNYKRLKWVYINSLKKGHGNEKLLVRIRHIILHYLHISDSSQQLTYIKKIFLLLYHFVFHASCACTYLGLLVGIGTCIVDYIKAKMCNFSIQTFLTIA